MKPDFMKAIFVLFCNSLFLIAFAQVLPSGAHHPVRERSYDIEHYRAEMDINFNQQSFTGTATLTIKPLYTISDFELDAIHLDVSSVSDGKNSLKFESSDTKLHITLPRQASPGQQLTITIKYACHPKGGMYFQPDPDHDGHYYMSTWGEGGLHANWLPIYNDTNDKFTTEMIVTTPSVYTVVSNGKLLDKKETGDRTTFHWRQEKPHSNYLISIYAAILERGELGSYDGVPIGYWVTKGRSAEADVVFKDTVKMMEFYTKMLDYPYPWEKYDQLTMPGYAPGAMEHTGITGHDWCVLRGENGPIEFFPTHEEITSDWTIDSIVSHELVHHWFGNNTTCRSLGYIWLNESFATYMALLWKETARGKDYQLYYVHIARSHYLDYFRATRNIRPLEYHYYDNRDEIFDIPITYLKGASIMHMLRMNIGDEAFFASLRHFMHKHDYANVESNDFKVAIQEASGKNTSVFFDQWISGGGHPQFDVSYTYHAGRKLLDLSVAQVQPIVEGQGLFDVPVDITIVTPSKTWSERLRVHEAAHSFLIPCADAPTMVSFDGEGSLVAEINFPKGLAELVYQAHHDAVPGRIWAIKQMVAQYPYEKDTVKALNSIIAGDAFWGVKAEAAQTLGAIRSQAAKDVIALALTQTDYHIRKGAVLALPGFDAAYAAKTLKEVIKGDKHSSVVSTAIVALSKVGSGVDAAYFEKLLERPSWNNEIIGATLQAIGALGYTEMTAKVKSYLTPRYHYLVRLNALLAWTGLAPDDPELAKTLIELTRSPVLALQGTAIATIAALDLQEGVPAIEAVVKSSADSNMVSAAEAALAQLERLRNGAQ